MSAWKRVNERPRNETFKCPKCDGKVHYLDRVSQIKDPKSWNECRYIYCPWCGEKIDGEEVSLVEVMNVTEHKLLDAFRTRSMDEWLIKLAFDEMRWEYARVSNRMDD